MRKKQEFCKNGHKLSDTRVISDGGHSRCRICDNMKSSRRRQKKHEQWLTFLQDSERLVCRKCGYDKSRAVLDFHHIEPADKIATISYYTSSGYGIDSAASMELDKTITLCKNCHAELHAGLWKLEELSNA